MKLCKFQTSYLLSYMFFNEDMADSVAARQLEQRQLKPGLKLVASRSAVFSCGSVYCTYLDDMDHKSSNFFGRL